MSATLIAALVLAGLGFLMTLACVEMEEWGLATICASVTCGCVAVAVVAAGGAQ